MYFSKNHSAQGTIEYLVILAVIVVIALIVVGLFTGIFSSPSQQILSSSSKTGEVAVGGISIVESVVDLEGDSLIKFTNNSSDSVNLTKISVGSVDNNYSSSDGYVAGLGSKTFSLSGLSSACPCESGQKSVKCEFKIEYTTASGVHTEYRTINVQCVTDSRPTNSSIVVNPIAPVLEDGSLENPWIINDCLELQDMNNHLDGNYILGNDIDCSGIDFTPIALCGSNYCDGLAASAAFRGSLDGNYNTISNLTINQPTSIGIGLFGYLRGTVSKVNLNNTQIISGDTYIGGLAGFAFGAVISKCSSSGTVIGSAYVGGLVGRAMVSSISESYVLGQVGDGSSSDVGGLVGAIDGTSISNCYFNGVATSSGDMGGITSYTSGYGVEIIPSSITSVYSVGSINGTDGDIGGISGGFSYGSVSNSFSTATINASGGAANGLIGGYPSENSITSSYWDTVLTTKSLCHSYGNTGCTSTSNNVSAYYGATGVTKLGGGAEWTAVDGNYPKLAWES